jgi:hypothetical protein
VCQVEVVEVVDGRWWMEDVGGEGDEKFLGKFRGDFGKERNSLEI